MNMNRFLVFVRADGAGWQLVGEAHSELSIAVRLTDHAVNSEAVNRSSVMEVSGTDAMPMFTYRYGARRVEKVLTARR